MTWTTTLKKLRDAESEVCKDVYRKLARRMGGVRAYGEDTPIHLKVVFESCGFDDAVECLRTVRGHDREVALFNVACARRVQHLVDDKKSIRALNVAESYARGDASLEDLESARDAAWSAVDGKARAAEAAWSAVVDVVLASVGRTTRYAAREAAGDSVLTGERPSAAWNARWEEERAAQEKLFLEIIGE